nr:pectin acetylesterase 8-like [Ipomoea batatas]
MAVSTRSNGWICLLIFSFVISVQYVNSDPIPQPAVQSVDDIIPKTIIQNATEKGAVCLDGSPAAYHFAPGKGEDARNWMIYLQGGGWCMSNGTYSTHDLSVESCPNRATRDMGSSFHMKPLPLKGIFGDVQAATYFYTWTRVIVRYCDGGSFAGNVDKPDPVTKLYYRGARIFQVVVDELMTKGLKDAKNVIFAGGSAGGLGVLVHCDRFTSLFPKGVRVKCLSDSSLFLIVKDPQHAKFFKAVFSDVVALHQPAKALPAECISKMSPFECFQPKNLVQYVKSPLFIFQSEFDSFQVQNTFSMDLYNATKKNVSSLSTSDMALLQDFKQQIVSALPRPSATKGYILTSMFGHSFASATYTTKLTFEDGKLKSIQSQFCDWYFDKKSVNFIDPSNVPHML